MLLGQGSPKLMRLDGWGGFRKKCHFVAHLATFQIFSKAEVPRWAECRNICYTRNKNYDERMSLILHHCVVPCGTGFWALDGRAELGQGEVARAQQGKKIMKLPCTIKSRRVITHG